MGVIQEVAGAAQNGVSPALLVQGLGIFVNFPGSHNRMTLGLALDWKLLEPG